MKEQNNTEDEVKGYDGKQEPVKDEKDQIIYYRSKYWRPAVAADSVVFGYDEKRGMLCVLLILRGEVPIEWALPGGFMKETDVDLKATAMRELKEETSVEIFMEEVGVFSEKGRDSRDRIISVAFMALVRMSSYFPKGGTDARKAGWFPVRDIINDDSPIKLAFDHKEIIMKALEQLQLDIRFRPIGLNLLEESFTMPQLCRLYLSILYPDYKYDVETEISAEGKVRLDNKDLPIERSNFSKKMLSLGYLDDDKEKNEEEKKTKLAYRRPNWYKFNKEKYDKLTKEGFYVVFNQKKRKDKSEKTPEANVNKNVPSKEEKGVEVRLMGERKTRRKPKADSNIE